MIQLSRFIGVMSTHAIPVLLLIIFILIKKQEESIVIKIGYYASIIWVLSVIFPMLYGGIMGFIGTGISSIEALELQLSTLSIIKSIASVVTVVCIFKYVLMKRIKT